MVLTPHDPTRPVDVAAFKQHVTQVAAVVTSEYGGDLDAYFTANPRTGLKLTPTGWQQVTHPEPGLGWSHPAEIACAATDYGVLRHCYRTAGRTYSTRNTEPVNTDGIWVGEYSESDEPRVATQIGRTPFDRTPPGPGTEPVLVTGDFEEGGPVFWPEAFWFDKQTATYALTAALRCDHRVDYDYEGYRRHVETEVWQTEDGRWVGRLTHPGDLNDQEWSDDDEVWCALDAPYVAHLMYCRGKAHIGPNVHRTVDLFRLVFAIENATDNLNRLDLDDVQTIAAIVAEVILPPARGIRDEYNDRSNQASRYTARDEVMAFIDRWCPLL